MLQLRTEGTRRNHHEGYPVDRQPTSAQPTSQPRRTTRYLRAGTPGNDRRAEDGGVPIRADSGEPGRHRVSGMHDGRAEEEPAVVEGTTLASGRPDDLASSPGRIQDETAAWRSCHRISCDQGGAARSHRDDTVQQPPEAHRNDATGTTVHPDVCEEERSEADDAGLRRTGRRERGSGETGGSTDPSEAGGEDSSSRQRHDGQSEHPGGGWNLPRRWKDEEPVWPGGARSALLRASGLDTSRPTHRVHSRGEAPRSEGDAGPTERDVLDPEGSDETQEDHSTVPSLPERACEALRSAYDGSATVSESNQESAVRERWSRPAGTDEDDHSCTDGEGLHRPIHVHVDESSSPGSRRRSLSEHLHWSSQTVHREERSSGLHPVRQRDELHAGSEDHEGSLES